MTCKKFETWLSSRPPYSDNDMPKNKADHLQGCPECKNAYQMDTRLETFIKNDLRQKNVPEDLFRRIDSAIDHADNRISVFAPKKLAAAAVVLFVLAAATYYGMFFNQPQRFQDLQQLSMKAVDRHLNKDLHMTFDTSNINQTLAMLRKEMRFNVILPDLSPKGYVLMGGRICSVGKCRAVYLFYENGSNTSSLFIMDYDLLNFQMADGSRFNNVVKGFRTEIWKENAQVYAMVH